MGGLSELEVIWRRLTVVGKAEDGENDVGHEELHVGLELEEGSMGYRRGDAWGRQGTRWGYEACGGKLRRGVLALGENCCDTRKRQERPRAKQTTRAQPSPLTHQLVGGAELYAALHEHQAEVHAAVGAESALRKLQTRDNGRSAGGQLQTRDNGRSAGGQSVRP